MKPIDAFYTRRDLAARYADEVAAIWPEPTTLFVEPAAGDGAFTDPLRARGRRVRGLDIAPRAAGIETGDFLRDGHTFGGRDQTVVVIGNPPFGRNAGLAVRFFRRAAEFADGIHFIVPRSFRKASIQRRLPKRWHLTDDRDVPTDAFRRNGRPHDVPCAWQTWLPMQDERGDEPPPNIGQWIEFTTPERADCAMRRVGFHAGRITTEGINGLSRNTHYFIAERTPGTIETLRQINWTPLAERTAGARSLAKSEIATALTDAMADATTTGEP